MQASTATLVMPANGLANVEAAFSQPDSTSTSQPAAATAGLLGAATGELVLRVCGGEHDGRVLRIQAAKCLIGSAAGCTLRLRTKHIRPVHVLILRGPNGAVVRCWTPDVLLNERACTESAIQAGDVLQIGPLKLHIEQVSQPPVCPNSVNNIASTSTQEVQSQPASILTQSLRNPRLKRQRKQLITLLRDERRERQSLRQTIDEQRSELASLQTRLIAASQAAESAPANESITAQLNKTIEQLQQELSAAAKRRTAEQQSASRQRQLFDEQLQQRLQSELDRQREQLQSCHQRQLEQARAELGRRLEQSKAAERLTFAAELDAVQRDAAAAREERNALAQEVDTLKLALQAKSNGEELARHSAATQIEQLSRAFELVREERDELFQRLQDEQQIFDEQVARWQSQIDDVRQSAQMQVTQGEAAAQEQLAKIRAELSARDDQLFELQQQAGEREIQLQTESQRQLADLRTRLTASAEAEELRRVADAQRISQLTGVIESLRAEATADAHARQQQQDGFTQARKRMEAEIAALTARLEQSDDALHEARVNSGQVQVEVLAEAEQARAERDAMREQMLRQQHEWTEFRSRLELAAAEERELASARNQNLQAELADRGQECEQLFAELTKTEQQLRELQARLDSTDDELSASSLEREQQKANLSGAEQRCRDLQAQLATVVDERDTLVVERSMLQQSAGEQQLQFEQLRTEINQLKANLDATIESQLTVEQEAQSQERELTCEIARLQDELACREQDCEQLRERLQATEQASEELRRELNDAVESRVVSERDAAGRMQQMTISMEQLHQEQECGAVEFEEERTEWARERDSLNQCVAELRADLASLQESLAATQEQNRQSTAESIGRAELAEQQLQSAQAQVAEWQGEAEAARQQTAELAQSIARLQQQEKLWQMEREQLDFTQQTSNERLVLLEASITDLQGQLAQAQSSISPYDSTRNTAILQSASGYGVGGLGIGGDAGVGGTINVNNQELAALHEQLSSSVPSLLDPRISADEFNAEVLRERAASLDERAEELAAQQAQLEEEQAVVARQRIELEQFQASLAELEKSLLSRKEALDQVPSPAATAQSQQSAAEESVAEATEYAADEPERESNPLSESEAFAAMADQVAALYRTPAPKSTVDSQLTVEKEIDSDHTAPENSDQNQGAIISPLDPSTESGESAYRTQLVNSPADFSPPEMTAILAPMVEEEFENTLDARIARVMGRESNSWHKPDGDGPEEDANLSQSDAVNNVLDRLREAGLWKGEGTAKVDHLPSCNPPVEGGASVLYRPSEELEPIGAEPAESAMSEAATPEVELTEDPTPEESEPQPEPETLAQSPEPANLLQPTANEESEGDDSIENYMSRLMQRLRTSSPADGAPESLRPSPSRTTGATSARLATPAAPPEPKPAPKPLEVTPLTSLAELAPRSQAPEANANLAAMRELANSAARGAIQQHQQKSGQELVTSRTVNTALAVIVAAGMLYCWYTTGVTLALAGTALAILWALSSTLLNRIQSASIRTSPTDGSGAGDEAESQ